MALEKDPNFFEARIELAKTYFALNKFKESEKEFLKVMKQNPSRTETHIELARVYAYLNKPDDAIKDAEIFLASRDDNPLAFEVIGMGHGGRRLTALVGSAIGALVDGVNAGLDLGDPKQASCGQKILKSAGAACSSLLGAESKYVKNPGKKNAGGKRDDARAKALDKVTKKVDSALAKDCPSESSGGAVAEAIEALAGSVTNDTTNSPNVDNAQFDTITPAGPVEYQGRTFTSVCMDGSPYSYFAKRGTVNKLLVYYQGGGACWEQLTCGVPVCDANVGEGDNPNGDFSGFADLDNPANPFRDWNVSLFRRPRHLCKLSVGPSRNRGKEAAPAAAESREARGPEKATTATATTSGLVKTGPIRRRQS